MTAYYSHYNKLRGTAKLSRQGQRNAKEAMLADVQLRGTNYLRKVVVDYKAFDSIRVSSEKQHKTAWATSNCSGSGRHPFLDTKTYQLIEEHKGGSAQLLQPGKLDMDAFGKCAAMLLFAMLITISVCLHNDLEQALLCR